jgi:trehalose 6-phosphate synthase
VLENHPEHRGRVVHLAVAYPSRQDIAEYRRYTEAMTDLAARINAEVGTDEWTPVRLHIADDYALSLAALSLADVLLINPVRDGMNLVVKEAVLLADDVAVVLSTGAGAADEMAGGALIVDPYDVTATADALHTALTMPASERTRRHDLLVRAATSMPPRQWLTAQLTDLE